jgi:FG-GAP repeat
MAVRNAIRRRARTTARDHRPLSRLSVLRVILVLAALGLPAMSLSPVAAHAAATTKSRPHSVSAPVTTTRLLATLKDPAGLNTDGFGSSVSISGSTAVVSSPYSGIVYIYTKSKTGWRTKPTVLLRDPVGPYEDFGWRVAISGKVIMVGAPGAGTYDAGAVYVYTQTGTSWPTTPSALLVCPASCSENFGIALKLSGTEAVVGSYNDGVVSSGGYHDGAAYIFSESSGTWQSVATLLNPDAGGLDLFGESVALSGTTVVVGAPRSTGSTTTSGPGAAYVYREVAGVWPTQPTVTLSDPGGVAGDYFGWAVAASLANIAVSAIEERQSATAVGAVFLYTASPSGAWPTSPTATLTSDQYGLFGEALAISSATIFVGQPQSPYNQGSVYGYAATGGIWGTAPIIDLIGPVVDLGGIGLSIAMFGTVLIAGSPCETSESGYPPGIVYIYNT